ncbi:hypothetical protein GE061_010026 [Apolygus lucorum]|uniref:Uncharacterized protein n=1 Tax=Apolygus lucorum TaxID=248454 RepID=A0A8S9Y375_APOLU|nr:hypothetical protein GE061_010026 [Apolygus lucorum]
MAKMVKADIAEVRSVVEEERAHLLDVSIRQVRIPIATEHSKEKVKKTGKGLKTKPGVRLGNGNFRNKRRKEENGWEEDGPDEIRERGKKWVEFQISATNFLGNPHYHVALLVDQNKPAKRDWKWAPAKEDSADRATKWKQELKIIMVNNSYWRLPSGAARECTEISL